MKITYGIFAFCRRPLRFPDKIKEKDVLLFMEI